MIIQEIIKKLESKKFIVETFDLSLRRSICKWNKIIAQPLWLSFLSIKERESKRLHSSSPLKCMLVKCEIRL